MISKKGALKITIWFWTAILFCPLTAEENRLFTVYNSLYLDSRYGHLIDSLTGDNDEEKLILARAFAAVGDKKSAIRQLSELTGDHIQSAALYCQYDDYKETRKIALANPGDSGFSSLAADYLLTLVESHNSFPSIERLQTLALSTVDVFKFKANLILTEYYCENGIPDSSMIALNNIYPDVLTIEDQINYYFLKVKLFCTFKDYDNALENFKNALSVRYLVEEKKSVLSFVVDSLSPALDNQQIIQLIKMLKEKGYYSKAIKSLKGIEPSDSNDLILAWCYLGKRNYSKAARIFKRLTQSPSETIKTEAEYGRAICNYRRGLRVKGVTQLLNFTKKYPENPLNPRALFIAGDFYQKSDLNKSINILQKLTGEYPESRYYTRALFLLGKSYAKLGLKNKAALTYSSYNRKDEFADIFDYWLYKFSPDYKPHLEKIVSRYNSSFYNFKTSEILGGSVKDSIFTYDEFMTGFIEKVEKFLSWRVKKKRIDEKQLSHVDSLFYYGLTDEAGRQLLNIYYRNSNLYSRLEVLKKSRKLRLDQVFFKVLDDLKGNLKRQGLSYSRDTWNGLNYPVLFKDLLSYNVNDIDPYLALAVIHRESRFNPHAVSEVGALGLMQLMPVTAAQMAGAKEICQKTLFNPGYNIKLGCKYLRWLRHRLQKNEVVVAAYNAGPTAAKRWRKQAGTDTETYIETIGYDQSRNYTRHVIGDYFWYKRLWPLEFNK